jgi:hypothetical protein
VRGGSVTIKYGAIGLFKKKRNLPLAINYLHSLRRTMKYDVTHVFTATDSTKRKPLTNIASFQLQIHQKQNIVIPETIMQHRRQGKRHFPSSSANFPNKIVKETPNLGLMPSEYKTTFQEHKNISLVFKFHRMDNKKYNRCEFPLHDDYELKDVVQCILAEMHRRFGETCCVHLQATRQPNRRYANTRLKGIAS